MSIQSNINQTISLAGYLASFNPALKAGVEHRKKLQDLSKRESIHEQAVATVAAKREAFENASGMDGETETLESGHVVYTPTLEEQAAERALTATEDALWGEEERLARERFELDPTPENYERVFAHESHTQTGNIMSERSETRLAQLRKKAELEAQESALTRDAEVARGRRVESIIEGVYSAQPDPRGTPEQRRAHTESIRKKPTGGES